MAKPNPSMEESLYINRLAVVMKEERWSNDRLAMELDYDRATISLWVNNHVQPPVTTFIRIALLMKRNVQDLFINTEKLDAEERQRYIEVLEKIAIRSKKTGKSRINRKN